MDAVLPSACTAEIAVHVDYTAADTKVFLYLRPFTVLIPSWVTSTHRLSQVHCAVYHAAIWRGCRAGPYSVWRTAAQLSWTDRDVVWGESGVCLAHAAAA